MPNAFGLSATRQNYARAACRALLFLVTLLCGANSTSAVTLTPQVQAHVREATFEVVMKKPERDSLTYEKPLPLDQLPFTERTDKYRSVGTAFAIGPNTYVSAAHVFVVGFASQFGEPALRDSSGNVRALDKVLKYSSEEDFIVFSLKVPYKVAALEVNRTPVLDEPVLAVGNALGEGIVIRDGLFTSQTPEQLDGRWKWIRFSAAASPGNSGGPLLDAQGRVIGVVLRKSENENLNYAVPISLILDAPSNLARTGGLIRYWLPVMDVQETKKMNVQVPLPKTYAELGKNITDIWIKRGEELQQNLLRKNAAIVFPRGAGSQQLLHTVYATGVLSMISRKADGNWDVVEPTTAANATLPHNGAVSYGVLNGTVFVKIKRPDDVSAANFYSDSKAFMDYVAKAMPLKRHVGLEEIRITSLGAAKQDTVFTDVYGRKWQVRNWTIEHEDSVIVAFALPVPDGYVVMARPRSTAMVSDSMLDLRAMTAFAYVTYTGTLEQWKGFLLQKPLLPANFANIKIDFDYARSFHYNSKRLSLDFDHALQKVQKDSLLSLRFAYLESDEKREPGKPAANVTWDVAGISLTEKKSGGPTLHVSRRLRPEPSLPDNFQSAWAKMVAREYPYNATVIESDGDTTIEAMFPTAAPGTPAAKDNTQVLYEIDYSREGKITQADMSAALAQWMKGLRVQEQ